MHGKQNVKKSVTYSLSNINLLSAWITLFYFIIYLIYKVSRVIVNQAMDV
jgi:hypothetical protein